MALLSLYDMLTLVGAPSFSAASSGGDEAPNPNSRTQLWVKNDAAALLSLTARSINITGADTEGNATLTDVGAADAFANVSRGNVLLLSGFTDPLDNVYVLVIESGADDEALVQKMDGANLVNESGQTDIGIARHHALTVKSERDAAFGPYKHHVMPLPPAAVTFTPAFDARRFNDVNGRLDFEVDSVTNVSVAAVEFGVRYQDLVR